MNTIRPIKSDKMTTQEKVLDKGLIERDAEQRLLKAQFYPGEKVKTEGMPESNVKVKFIGSTGQKSWLRQAYVIASSSWTREVPQEFYESFKDGYNFDRMADVLKKEKGATVPFECFEMTIAIENVSRAMTHQIVRHRQFGFGQESFRNTDLRNHNYRIPFDIMKNPELKAKYEEQQKKNYELYAELVDKGMPYEQARALLGMGTETYIVITGNLRAWISYFQARRGEIAQYEHTVIANQILEQFKEHCPYIYEVIKDRIGE
jgi:thymidylate synthase (FAD)